MRPSSSFSQKQPSWVLWGLGAVVLFLLIGCVTTLVLVFSGKTRRTPAPVSDSVVASTSRTTVTQAVRRLDGMPTTTSSTERLQPRAVMVDNQVDARPAFGLSSANIAIESPVEGGITRFLLIFDPSTELPQVGPVRSARPYFVDWAAGWHAAFFHVGGSPEALDQLKKTDTVVDINEMAKGWAFWRESTRVAPHQVMTSQDRMNVVLQDAPTSTGWTGSWQFTRSDASSTHGDVTQVKIPYGGSYSVRWNYESSSNSYVRSVSGRAATPSDAPVKANNVVVLKTDARILDEKGRLKVRTTGSGEAVLYRDGKKFPMRWRRSSGEVLEFVDQDGTDVPLNPGKTWIQVTADDQTFAGLGQ